MESEKDVQPKPIRRWAVVICAAIITVAVPQLVVDSEVYARVLSIGGLCLLLWISEIVPAFVPTLLLWTLVPIFLSPFDAKFALPNVLSWAVDPVMALFFGGFVLGTATQAQGLDEQLAAFALRSAGGSVNRLLLIVILLTAFFSMWMSNIAAAAMVFACLQPVLAKVENDDILRRSLLVAVALGADLGGMATPIGTGPNAIAIASISSKHPISFLSWMVFALPLTVGMLTVSYVFLLWKMGKTQRPAFATFGALTASGLAADISEGNRYSRTAFVLIFAATIFLWLTEPIHGIPAAVTALGSSAAIFLTGVLSKRDLARIDWSTLLLIAGGITLGRLLEQSSIISNLAASIPFAEMDPRLSLFLLCLAAALLSALMSNTATAVLLIPIAMVLVPSPSTAILIAISASFGVPFIISTPPNAMAFGQGGLRFSDMFWPGLIVMILGCAIVSLTGQSFLGMLGIR